VRASTGSSVREELKICEPITLGAIAGIATGAAGSAGALGAALTASQAIALGATVGSGVMVAGSAYQQGQVAKQTARNNATMAEYAAQDAQRRGEEQVQSIQRKAAGLKGAQRSIMASRGLDLGAGTPAELLDQTDFFAEQDVATTRYNASRDAWSSRAQGQDMLTQGRYAARNANMQAAGTLLGAAGSVASKWNTYAPKPAFAGYGDKY
jgi:hypothetical protein